METSVLVIAEPAVCLVDSDPAVRDSLQNLAALYGQTVRCFSTARAFLDDLHGQPVRCVICEARLPDQRGVDVHMTLLAWGLRLPFALLVSRDIERVTTDATARGIDLVVPKPIMDVSPLLDFIREHASAMAFGAVREY
jgi:FixJ family two-component response regulator